MTLPKPARLLLTHGRPLILRGWHPESCIASTAIGIKVLARFGIKSWPVPVHMRALNPIYIRMLEELDGRDPTEEEVQTWVQRGAWSIEVRQDGEVPGRYTGHLVIGVANHLVDLSLDQAARPTKNLLLEPTSVKTTPEFYDNEEPTWRMVNDSLVMYYHQPENTDYENSPDWKGEDGRHDGIVPAIERQIRSQLTRKARR